MSLREAIADDRRLKKHSFYVEREHKPGRNLGWLKILNSEPDRYGAIKID